MVLLRSTPINISNFKKNMSSSTFEVKEPESDSEKVFDIESLEPEENGLELSTNVDGEVPKDHTYTKEPAVDEEEDKESPESDIMEGSPKKKAGRPSRGKKPIIAKGKKEVKEPVKKEPVSKRGRKKENEDGANAPDENISNGEAESKVENSESTEEATPKVSRRGKKRKVDEKENIIDQSIVDEVLNITEDTTAEKSETAAESPAKKKKTTKEETPKAKKPAKPAKSKDVSPGDVIEDKTNVPKGWVKKLVVRKSGKTAGMVDVYIYSPDGIKFRSKPDVAAYLVKTKSSLKIDDFDFSKKKAEGTISSKSAPKAKSAAPAKTKVEKKKAETPKKKTAKLVVKITASKKKKEVKTKTETKQSKSADKAVKTKTTKAKGSKKKKN